MCEHPWNLKYTLQSASFHKVEVPLCASWRTNHCPGWGRCVVCKLLKFHRRVIYSGVVSDTHTHMHTYVEREEERWRTTPLGRTSTDCTSAGRRSIPPSATASCQGARCKHTDSWVCAGWAGRVSPINYVFELCNLMTHKVNTWNCLE